MATATARVPVLMTGKEKAQIAKRAKDAGLSMGEYLRRAAQSFRPSEDDKALEAMIDQMLKATERANQAIDEALAFVEASNQRISMMEARRKAA
ncbi:MAG: plasmid mobilization protein [Sulfuricaulis sp.]